MLEVSDSDLRLLEEFQLKWRWTDAKWNKLPPTIIQQINPLAKEKASEIVKIHNQYFLADGLDSESFEEIKSIKADTTDSSAIQNRLKNKVFDESLLIVVSWTEDLAVRTTWSTFCDYWDDFCYPASDDVSISPIDLSWLLFYHHEEYFDFGKVKGVSLINVKNF